MNREIFILPFFYVSTFEIITTCVFFRFIQTVGFIILSHKTHLKRNMFYIGDPYPCTRARRVTDVSRVGGSDSREWMKYPVGKHGERKFCKTEFVFLLWYLALEGVVRPPDNFRVRDWYYELYFVPAFISSI
jgi:hypothetical protein